MADLPIVLVKNLPFNASTNAIHQLCQQFGHVLQIRISDGSAPQGTAFVIYSNMVGATKAARELNGVNFQSRYLVASLYQVEPKLLEKLQQGNGNGASGEVDESR